jgi:phospholipase C
VGTTNELFTGTASYPASSYTPGPYGLGVRVPMIVISPWSKGGWVNSEVFDHTSLIRFLERRFGVVEPNITAWRRAVVGDLTSAFNFASPNDSVVSLPSTASYQPPNQNRYPDYVPAAPANQVLPRQEPGTRPARPLPYELHVHGEVDASNGSVQLFFRNTGKGGAVVQVRSGDGSTGPWTYTVGAGDGASDSLAISGPTYDFSIFGPNGFLRTLTGSLAASSAGLAVKASYDTESGGIALVIQNHGSSTENVSIFDKYSGRIHTQEVHGANSSTNIRQLQKSFGWYDLTVRVDSDPSFQRQFAGHVETGRPSVTDPAIGGGESESE